MKKLLTLVLTLVIAISLVNTNNQTIKAEGTTYTYSYHSGDFHLSPSMPADGFSKGDVIQFVDNATANVKVCDPYGVNHNCTGPVQDAFYTYTIEHNNTTITKGGTNNVELTISDPKIAITKGLIYDGTNWYDGNKSVENKLDTDVKLAAFGITYDNTTKTAKLSKSLSCNTSGAATIRIEQNKEIHFELEDDITIVQTVGNLCFDLVANVSFDGKNHTLTLKPTTTAAIYNYHSNETTSFKNIKVVATSGSSYGTIMLDGYMNIENSELYITNTNLGNDAYALKVGKALDQTVIDNFDFLGKVNLTDTSLSTTVRGADGKNKISGNNARYVVVKAKQPVPPEPVPAAEDNSTPTTCEYVIGPRWHWNDEKGVCELEGYSVINTATK